MTPEEAEQRLLRLTSQLPESKFPAALDTPPGAAVLMRPGATGDQGGDDESTARGRTAGPTTRAYCCNDLQDDRAARTRLAPGRVRQPDAQSGAEARGDAELRRSRYRDLSRSLRSDIGSVGDQSQHRSGLSAGQCLRECSDVGLSESDQDDGA